MLLALIGLFNIFGSYLFGALGGRYRQKWVLAAIYLAREHLHGQQRMTAELEKITTAAKAARKMGLVVFAGHGLNYRNIDAIAINEDIEELNIGHSIIARAALVGLKAAVREMIALMNKPRRLPPSAR